MKKTFYGWWVLLGLSLMYAASNGIGMNTLPLFFPEMARQFGWDPAKATLPSSLFYLTVAAVSPFAGQWLDKTSPRRLLTIGGIGVVLALLALPFVSSFGQLIAFYIAFPLALTLGGIVTSMYILRQWFHRKLGLAIGLFLNASSLGGAIFSPLAGRIIKESGWQQAAQTITLIGAFCLILPLFWVRSRPADVGQLPDGDAQLTTPDLPITTAYGQTGVGFGQAMRFPGFWLLTVVTGVLWFCITGFLSSQGFYYKDLRFDPAQAGKISGLFFACAVVGKITFGYLSDRFDKRTIMTLAIGCLLAGVLVMKLSLGNPSLVYGFAVLYGIGYSAAFTMIQILVAEYYRGRDYGSILGVVTMVDTLAGFAGVVVIGASRKSTGSFDSAFMLMMSLCALALVATFFVRKPVAVAPAAPGM